MTDKPRKIDPRAIDALAQSAATTLAWMERCVKAEEDRDTLHTRALAAEARVRELTAPLDGDEGRELVERLRERMGTYSDCDVKTRGALNDAAAYIERQAALIAAYERNSIESDAENVAHGKMIIDQAARITALTAPPSEEVVERVAISLCKKWPKTPDGCAMLCMDRLGGIPAAGCRHAKHVHGERARTAIEALQKGEQP